MWVLESNGDFLQGKRMWLKPGKKYLFGRVKKDGVRFAIDHKTVSRKHFVITVDEVRDENVGRVHVRTRITIKDENSKAGTNIDGELIKNKSQELKNTVNSVRPGSCPHELVISWIPCVITFSLNKKEIKSGLLKDKQLRVKDLDIRAVSDYLAAQTTHLVAQKRNTAKGLQALLEARPIITESYIDALIYASTPTDLQEEENLCPLEIDFDDGWPDPTLHLPPPGKEPTTQPAAAYKPDVTRAKVFEKHTFFFFDQTQYDSLFPPVTTGHGKAMLLRTIQDVTSVDEAIGLVRSAVGSQGKFVLVHLADPEDPRVWLARFIENLCIALGQSSASQSDFLDTILANDASQLRQSPPQSNLQPRQLTHNVASTPKSSSDLRVEGVVTNGSTQAQQDSHGHLPARSTHSSSPSRHDSADPEHVVSRIAEETIEQQSFGDDNPRPRKRSRFASSNRTWEAFDDDFNPNGITAYEEDPLQNETRSTLHHSNHSHLSNGEVAIKKESTTKSKQANSTEQAIDASDDMDELLPATAAMRIEKQRQQAEAQHNGHSLKPMHPILKTLGPEKQKQEKKLLNVREVVRAQREAEKEAENKQKESDEQQAQDDEWSGPANVVRIKAYKLPVREKDEDFQTSYRGDSWKPEWEGRMNFKGFRRARDMHNQGSGHQHKDKIIVPVAPVQNNSYGIGDQYWAKTQDDKERAARAREKRKKASQPCIQDQRKDKSHSQRSETIQGASEPENNDSDSDPDSDPDSDKQTNTETARLQQEAEGLLDHPIDVDAPRQTRGGDTYTQVSTSTATSRNTQSHKRAASKTPPGKATIAKKQRALPITKLHGAETNRPNGGIDDGDSDDMKFTFGRAKKARAAKK